VTKVEDGGETFAPVPPEDNPGGSSARTGRGGDARNTATDFATVLEDMAARRTAEEARRAEVEARRDEVSWQEIAALQQSMTARTTSVLDFIRKTDTARIANGMRKDEADRKDRREERKEWFSSLYKNFQGGRGPTG
jgi:hypothetical protein